MRPRAIWTNGQYWNSPNQVGVHHFARCLVARGWDVAFVSDPISPLHFLKLSSLKETRDRFATWRVGGQRDLDSHLFYYTPFTLLPHYNAPLLRTRWVLDNWRNLTIPNVQRKLAANGFGQVDLLIADSIAQSFWIDALKPRRTIMRVADDLSGFKGVSKAMVDREHTLIGRVDHIIYTAHGLADRIRSHNPRAMTYVSNGVDLRHFQVPTPAMPEEYTKIPGPRVLYVGAIEHWFDDELLAAAARSLPHASFVIIGPQRAPLTALEKLPNVHILGRRAYALVPAFMHHAHVGVIPFKIDKMINCVNPIKLYEYMACGLPVVSASWEELRAIGSPAALCTSTSEFTQAVKNAIDTPPDREALKQFADNADWRKRFEVLAEAVGLKELESRASN